MKPKTAPSLEPKPKTSQRSCLFWNSPEIIKYSRSVYCSSRVPEDTPDRKRNDENSFNFLWSMQDHFFCNMKAPFSDSFWFFFSKDGSQSGRLESFSEPRSLLLFNFLIPYSCLHQIEHLETNYKTDTILMELIIRKTRRQATNCANP